MTASADSVPGSRQLARGVVATWWYTASGVVFLEAMLVLFWTILAFAVPGTITPGVVVAVGGLLWCASTVLLLRDYRHRHDAAPGVAWRSILVPLAVAVAFGVAAGTLVGSWQLGVMPIVQSLALLNWPAGLRYRVTIAAVLVMMVLGFIDAQGADGGIWWVPILYTALLPVMTVSTLWWWDVLMTLDRARASEARLAATQERLRVATDVHDLQGHHLQVIALQLELAERLMPSDADAGMEQLRAARASVDDARQGTRDLATKFRSVPLGDELANARDLLRAAGLDVTTDIAPDAGAAPASALGPVVRETTTNALRHGGGHHARLSLRREPGGWRYEIANDVSPQATTDAEGSGLEGMARRVGEAGGSFDVRRDGGEFVVTAVVPDAEGAR
ncbi:sensor histidine kinase [Microbacterium sp. 179-I 3D4 NHS]|uniref:sensor histidine kinase n=1 Tax=Microbacterium sp. 179-I 3D4 NHS TaxID=3142381 RepID=UPI00399F44CB